MSASQQDTNAEKASELQAYEERLKQWETMLEAREHGMKQKLQDEMERLAKEFERTSEQRVIGMQKRYVLRATSAVTVI